MGGTGGSAPGKQQQADGEACDQKRFSFHGVLLFGRVFYHETGLYRYYISVQFEKQQEIAKRKHSPNILAIFPEKALCAVEARPEKTGGTLSRVASAVLGLRERLAQQALDGHIARIVSQVCPTQLPAKIRPSGISSRPAS